MRAIRGASFVAITPAVQTTDPAPIEWIDTLANAASIAIAPRDGSVFGSGRMSIEEIVAKLDTGAASRDAAKLSAKEVFDVLIIGAGGERLLYQAVHRAALEQHHQNLAARAGWQRRAR